MAREIPDAHIEEEVDKILKLNGGEAPSYVACITAQTAVERSPVDVDTLTQREYDMIFGKTRRRIREELETRDR